jgi:L-alanine-DL-glutamate epimerase-like enolase superfamily enzyme
MDAYDDPELVRGAVRKALDAGFHGVKLHEKKFPVITAASDEAGSDVDLMVDVNCAWSANEAAQKARELLPLGLKWLEEPVWPPENYAGLARVRRVGVPLAAGENIPTLLEFGRILGAKSVDYIQPSPAKVGGITELAKAFTAAELNNTPVMPHTFYDGPGLLAGIHAVAVWGSAESMIEWRYFDLEAYPYGDRLTAENGQVKVPQGAGLGLDPDPDFLSTYLHEPE